MTATVVPLPTTRTRRLNYTGSESCRCCHNTGWLVVGTETRNRVERKDTFEAEVMGPCPRCERGFRVEFGLGRRRKERGEGYEEYENPDGGPWGKDGYWRGQPIPERLA